jgi:hypothetical protein
VPSARTNGTLETRWSGRYERARDSEASMLLSSGQAGFASPLVLIVTHSVASAIRSTNTLLVTGSTLAP